MARFRPLLIKVLLVFVSFAVFGLIAEMVVRLTVDGPLVPRFVQDSGYGIRMPVPNETYQHYYPGDYDITINTNNVGARGTRDYDITKSPGQRRIALIGDSFIFGYGVEDKETVGAQLQQQLGAKTEVLSFAVSGFGQAEQLVMADHLIKSYEIDLAVLFFFDNDIKNNINSGLYRLDDQGQLQRTGQSYLPGVKLREWLHAIWITDFFFRHSRLWNLVRERAAGWVHLRNEERNEDPDRQKQARALTTALLATLGARFPEAVVYVIPLCHRKTRKLSTNFDQVSRGISEKFKVLGGSEEHGPDQYHDTDTHWNKTGHRRAAEVLSQWIQAKEAGNTNSVTAEPLDKVESSTP